jgi:alpha-beta hydrolase superfamily lysophospholipase
MATDRPAWRKSAIRVAAALLAVAGVSLAVMSCRMIDAAAVRLTEPRRYNLGPDARQLADHPEAEGMRVRRHTVTAADGIRLPLLVMDPLPEAPATQARRRELAAAGLDPTATGPAPGTVLMLHGINSRKEHMLWTAKWLTAAGYRCIAWDSRGHGESDPAKATFGAREAADTETVYQFLRRERQLHGRTLLYGHSMGAAVAVQWLPGHPEIEAVALSAPFARLSGVMDFQASRLAGGSMKLLVPLVRGRVRSIAGYDPYQINPVDVIGSVRAPVLIFHGRGDDVVPPSQSEALLAACRHPDSTRVLTGGGHNNPLSCGGAANYATLIRFFQPQHPPPVPP